MPCVFALFFPLFAFFFLFFFFDFFSEARQQKRPIWCRKTFTWEELGSNFCEIHRGVYNRQLDDSAALDQDNQTYGTGWSHTGLLEIFNVKSHD